MTDTEINIAIAEWCGWKKRPDLNWSVRTKWDCEQCFEAYEKGGVIKAVECLPSYATDLNAMQSALKTQTPEFNMDFAQELRAHADRIACMMHELPASHWADIFLQCKRRERKLNA